MAKQRKTKRSNGEGTIVKKKNGRYSGAITLGHDENGKQIRKYFSAKTLEEAQQKLRDLLLERDRGISLDAYTTTLSDFLDQWLAYKHRTVRLNTYENYRFIVEHQVRKRFGHYKLRDITALSVEAAVVAMLREGWSAALTRRALSTLKTALKQAVIWQLLKDNPAQHIKPPPLPRQEMKVWTAEQVKQFLSHAKTNRYYALFYLALATGARRGELLGLHWKDVDLQEGSIYIRYSLSETKGKLFLGEPKTRASLRRIMLAEDAIAVLRDHRLNQELEFGLLAKTVFVSEADTYVNPRNMQRNYDRLIKRSGVPKIRFHDLRHTAASLLIKRGVSAKVVAERLGHANPSITLNTYIHMYKEQRQEGVVSLMEVLDEA